MNIKDINVMANTIGRYVNFHKHSDFSNLSSVDCPIKVSHYVERALELGHNVITSVEHGVTQGWLNYYDEVASAGLKFVFGCEVYFVKDRNPELKDNANSHLILLARNYDGMKQINRIVSEAAVSGYYYRPRVDLELLMTLNPEDVMVTTACVGSFFNKYEDYMDIFNQLKSHFTHFYLEVQAHDTDKQKKYNNAILKLAKATGTPIIAGVDSHVITSEQVFDRDQYLLSKGISYEDEYGWYLHYPDTAELIAMFVQQGCLSAQEIKDAIANTLVIEEFDDIHISKDPKLPTIYPNHTQEQKDIILWNILMDNFRKYQDIYEKAKTHEYYYMQEIQKEYDIVVETKMADYFLLTYEMVVLGEQKYGGMVTASGRGSASSFFITMLLGLTTVDRLAEEVPLFPERFMTASRILETKSLPDIDINTANPVPFQLALKELLGEHSAYYMSAYGKLKEKSAMKMYMKSQNIPFDVANEVTKQLEKYEMELKYHKDDSIDDDDDNVNHISVYDFIDEKYVPMLEASKKYLGIVDSVSPSPCAFLVINGDIREEIGISKARGEGNFIANIDGKLADKYGFLKEDILTVSVVDIIDKTFKRIGVENWKEQYPSAKLKEMTKFDNDIWNVYHNGATMCINQVESVATTQKSMKYKPSSLEEVCAFVAAIRPSAQSIYKDFEQRNPYSYSIKLLDDDLRQGYKDGSFILYQEQIMSVLGMAGIPQSKTYEIIKAISKKNHDKINSAKEDFINGFVEKLMQQ